MPLVFMGSHSQVGSRRSSGQKFQKSVHEKAKVKEQKRKSGNKYLPEEKPEVTPEEISEKTISHLNRLGTQTFAISPFSDYFDDWLINLREVLAKFESNPAVTVNEQFVKERLQIVTDVEREFAEKRLKETASRETVMALATNNHLLVEIDAEYATKTRENGTKRNAKIESLTEIVHELEHELDKTRQMKTSFFSFTKKAKEKKEAETGHKLNSVKSELEIAIQSFKAEQGVLHDSYEKRKQEIIEKVQSLEKELATFETDSSIEVRQATCNALINSINNILKRKPLSNQSANPLDQ
jgi:hypothetical protein